MPRKTRFQKRKIALILPAHNEELVIVDTINSALAAGQPKQDIYVVDDNSSDKTSKLAKKALGASQVLKVSRSGKAGAIKKAYDCFNIGARYQWVHIADADGVFGPTYFIELGKNLNRKYAAVTGHVQSLPGSWVAQFRTLEYTIGLELMRRIQAWLGVITVIPGPTSCFRTDIFEKIEFDGDSLTEDFDATLQIHRRKLGKIAYVPSAEAFTQDPKTYRDFVNQVSRWYRGFFQGLKKHRIGLQLNKIDAYIGYMLAENATMTLELIFVLIAAILSRRGLYILSIYIIFDLMIQVFWSVLAAKINHRWDILKAFPLFYVLRFTNLYVFYRSMFEVVVLNKFSGATKPGWDTRGRRYRMQTAMALTKGDA